MCCSSCFYQSVPDKKEDTFRPRAYRTKTADGWDIALKRFNKPDNSNKKKLPVVLCHGFNYNDRFWYLDRDYSLACYLYERGYDVWLISLRGSGNSTKPGLAEFHSLSRFELIKMPETLAKAALTLNKFNWNIDDHINKDIPAALELIKKETGYEKVNWIGHSLGGMIIYAYLEAGGEGINNFISVASPMMVPRPPNDILAVIRDQRPAVYLSMLINRTVASQFKALTGGQNDDIDLLFYNPDNVDKNIKIKMFRYAVEDISPGAIDQLRIMIIEGEFLSADKKINYSANLSKVSVPILCIGGMADNLAPPMSIYFPYEKVSSQDKTIRIFSLANRYSANYGHSDLIIGKKAPQEVYPYILNWLRNREK
jgi:polyhydroxyalkanoate synthase